MKVIHVDSNKFALDAMRDEFSRIVPEAELHCFELPDSALAFAEAQGCDVLLTEIELWADRLGGIRLARALREICPGISIFFVTVCSENEVAGELSGLPVVEFFPKPWDSSQLAEVFSSLRNTKGEKRWNKIAI